MDSMYEKDRLELSKLLNLLLLCGFLGMTVLSLVLGIGLAYVSKEKSRTLVPPSISQAFTVSDGHIDNAYLSMMGDYFLYLKLNVTPANVTRQFGRLLDYVPPQNYPIYQPVLIEEAQLIKESNISSRFDPIKTEVSLDDLQIKITGNLTKSVGDRFLPTEEATYAIQMGYDYGVIELLGIKRMESIQ